MRLDAQLAADRPPEWSRLYTVRAGQLVSRPFRTELAANWNRVLEIATGEMLGTASGRRLLRREPIANAAPQIRELVNLLLGPEPVTARGVATAHLLLTDGTGPLYSRLSTTVLSDALAEAVALLQLSAPPQANPRP